MSFSKRTLFGTDGIRGRANHPPMTPDLLARIAQAVALEFKNSSSPALVVIGKDTRLSGYMIEPALVAGFISMGMDVFLLGPLPTPAVSMLTRSLRASFGVMISASHNPYQDNGIKLFGPDGQKLSDLRELEIEKKINNFTDCLLAPADQLGRAKRLDDAPGRYIEFVKSTFPAGLRLDGLKVVIDCAQGAAYKIAPTVLWELGAEIIPLGVSPDGRNINLDCGAMSPQGMARAVVEHGASIGLALDGDADRLVIADEKGLLVHGDQLLGAIALWWKSQGRLHSDCFVTTIMSNMGLVREMEKQGITVIQASVGDRYVSESMEKHKAALGGEPSGHIIFREYGSAGDGLAAALQVLACMRLTQRPVSEICKVFKPLPQVSKNFPLKKGDKKKIDLFMDSLQGIEKKLGSAGRLIIRQSGTEPMLRVMLEHEQDVVLRKLILETEALFDDIFKS